MNEANRNLIVRVATALVLGPPLLAVVLWDKPIGFVLVVHAASVVGLAELYWIALRTESVGVRVLGLVLGAALSVAMYWAPELLGAVLIAGVIAAASVTLVYSHDLSRAPTTMALIGFGLLYVPVLLTPLALLKRMPDGTDWVVLVFLVTWMSDTGAYAAGRAFGKNKLYPAVSPGKTVEGSLGGLVASFGGAALAKLWFMPQISWFDAALIALPGGALGQVGDLVESMIKRAYGVKDSGKTIPGHGGLLDRVDALLFSTGYVYLYAQYVFFAR